MSRKRSDDFLERSFQMAEVIEAYKNGRASKQEPAFQFVVEPVAGLELLAAVPDPYDNVDLEAAADAFVHDELTMAALLGRDPDFSTIARVAQQARAWIVFWSVRGGSLRAEFQAALVEAGPLAHRMAELAKRQLAKRGIGSWQ